MYTIIGNIIPPIAVLTSGYNEVTRDVRKVHF